MTEPTDGGGGSMSVAEVTGLVHLFNGQLLAMEGRLSVKLDEHARSSNDRWVKHEAQHLADVDIANRRFEKLETALLTVEQSLETHLDREHDEDVAAEARVKPIKGIAAWFWRNWRDVVLLFIGLVAAGTFFLDWLTHIFNGVPT